jgi:DNA-binding beta-propeller fold protein YncE
MKVSFLLCAIALLSPAAGKAQKQPLRLVQTIPLPKVEKRLDHLAVDLAHKRLFVAALGNNTVEVIDLAAGKRIHTISKLHGPQGLAYAPTTNRLFVAYKETGGCDAFDATTYKLVGETVFSDVDADNVRYDAKANQVVIGVGDGFLSFIDATSYANNGTFFLSGHPESFQLERSGTRIFVNVPKAGHIEVIDRVQKKLLAKWPITGARANFPMALDEAGHRLFIGCREPARVLIYDTNSGKQTGSFVVSGDTDDLFFDPALKRLYASCGAGFLDVFKQKDESHFDRIGHISTAAGARTCLFVPELKRLYLAVPHQGAQKAEIRAYAVSP